MKTFFLAVSVAFACSVGAAETAAPQAPTATPRELHAAQCVAALEVETEALAQRVKAGADDDRALLQSRLEAGTAFVGDSYLNGLTDEHRAHELANQALDAQKSLSDAQLVARQQACAVEGRKLLDASNPLQQVVVKRLAQRRMSKLLASS